MIKLFIAGIIGLVIIISLIIIVRNKPDFWFWIFLNLFFDPGGYVYGFLGGTLVGPLHITDVFISGIIICLMSAHVNWKVLFEDQFLRKYLFFLVIFTLYYYIVYGGVVPYLQNDLDYNTFLVKNRVFAYGFIILISVYVFSLRGLYYFYTSTLFVGTICLTLYFITLITGIPLIPIEEMARYTGEDMKRIFMMDYGLFYSLFGLSLIVYFLSKKIKLDLRFKYVLYYSGIIMIMAQLITLTRRTQIDLIASVLIIILIISYLFRTSKLSSILKIITPAFVVILIMSFTFPKYIGYIAEIGEDTFLLMTTGFDSRGQSDQRVSGNREYEVVKDYINKNLFFGTGYTKLYWKDGRATSSRGINFARAADAAGEVPIYYLFFGYGLVGAVLLLPLYIIMGQLFFKVLKSLRFILINFLGKPLLIVFSIFILSFIAGKFTYNFYNLSLDFTGANLSFTSVFMGIGMALLRMSYTNIFKMNYN